MTLDHRQAIDDLESFFSQFCVASRGKDTPGKQESGQKQNFHVDMTPV